MERVNEKNSGVLVFWLLKQSSVSVKERKRILDPFHCLLSLHGQGHRQPQINVRRVAFKAASEIFRYAPYIMNIHKTKGKKEGKRIKSTLIMMNTE